MSWRSVQAFANDPLHIQIRQEYFIKLVKYKFQRGWFIQIKIQYQLRQSALRPLGTGLLLVLAQPHCGTLFLQISGLSRVFRISSTRKRPFYFVWHLPNEPITVCVVYSDCRVFIFIFSKCTVCYVLVFVSFNLLVL